VPTGPPARIFWLAFLCIVVAGICAGAALGQPGGGLESGDPAPEFRVTTLAGEVLNLSDLRGRVVVLNFWFIACPPCLAEIPQLNRVVKRFQGEDVVFIAFSPDQEDELEKFLARHPFDYQVVARATPTAERYGITGAPTHLLIDREGVVRDIRRGAIDDPESDLVQPILELLK
jgi:peroxiredoxin